MREAFSQKSSLFRRLFGRPVKTQEVEEVPEQKDSVLELLDLLDSDIFDTSRIRKVYTRPGPSYMAHDRDRYRTELIHSLCRLNEVLKKVDDRGFSWVVSSYAGKLADARSSLTVHDRELKSFTESIDFMMSMYVEEGKEVDPEFLVKQITDIMMIWNQFRYYYVSGASHKTPYCFTKMLKRCESLDELAMLTEYMVWLGESGQVNLLLLPSDQDQDDRDVLAELRRQHGIPFEWISTVNFIVEKP